MTATDAAEPMELTVSATTNVHQLAVRITNEIESGKRIRMVAIGANALNQTVKAGIKSAGFLAPRGRSLLWHIFFTDRDVPVDRPEGGSMTWRKLVEEGVIVPEPDAPPVAMRRVTAIVFESCIV